MEHLRSLTTTYDLAYAVFGDIDIQSHRDWEEKVSSAASLKALLPIWQQSRKQLVYDMIAYGIEAIIVSCNNTLGPDFLGRVIDKTLVEALALMGVDACGENGEVPYIGNQCASLSRKIKL